MNLWITRNGKIYLRRNKMEFEINYVREYNYNEIIDAKDIDEARIKADELLSKILKDNEFEDVAQKGYIDINVWEVK